jgi:hypothetical protein
LLDGDDQMRFRHRMVHGLLSSWALVRVGEGVG